MTSSLITHFKTHVDNVNDLFNVLESCTADCKIGLFSVKDDASPILLRSGSVTKIYPVMMIVMLDNKHFIKITRVDSYGTIDTIYDYEDDNISYDVISIARRVPFNVNFHRQLSDGRQK